MRAFIVVLDGLGVGALPDAPRYGDAGSNTLAALCAAQAKLPNLAGLGLFNIEGVACGEPARAPSAAFGRMAERSAGKDSTTGHWELAGLCTHTPFPTYPKGFPPETLDILRRISGRELLCNLPYSGTEVIRDYGREQLATGALIVYTSADSVLQIAAHEALIPPAELHRVCRELRDALSGPGAVSRVIARPFTGDWPRYVRTAARHDYSLPPTGETLPSVLQAAGLRTVGIGKIGDLFAGVGLDVSLPTASNKEGIDRLLEQLGSDFDGLCFVNLVDFDVLYGHRNDAAGYARALEDFDAWVPELLAALASDDLLFLTADHGCDPATPSTDHSREYIPLLVCGQGVRPGAALGTRGSFADLSATVLDYFGLPNTLAGESFLPLLRA